MYLLGSVFILLIMGLILIFAVGLPILAAILVYHDANKRIDCSPWLWALAAAFVPCYIGVIIYLIIRKDYPLKSGAGDFGYRYSGNHTESCYDSQYEEGENAGFRYTGKKPFPTWAKALIIIVAVIVVICLIAFAVSAVKAIAGYSVIYSSPYHYGF